MKTTKASSYYGEPDCHNIGINDLTENSRTIQVQERQPRGRNFAEGQASKDVPTLNATEDSE